MRLIDADAKIVAQLYDDEHEDWILKEMTVADYLSFSDTSTPFIDAVPVVRCEYCKYHIVSRQGRLYCIHGFEQTLFSAFSAVDNPIFEREFDSFCSYGKRREE